MTQTEVSGSTPKKKTTRKTKSAKTKKPLSLRRIFEEKLPMYLRNMTHRHSAARKTRQILSINSTNTLTSKPEIIHIPPVGVPFCVTDYVTHDTLEASTDLRAFLRHGLCVLVEIEEAEAELVRPGAQERLRAAMIDMGKISGEIDMSLTTDDEITTELTPIYEEEVVHVHPRLMHLLLTVSQDQLSPSQGLYQIQELHDTGALKEADFHHIVGYPKDPETDRDLIEAIRTWAQEQIDTN